MKNRQQIKDMKALLKDMEPYVKDAKFLHSGRRFGNFNLLPREVWGNWLFCVVLQKLHGAAITFAEDDKGDGIIIDKKTGQTVPTEHVSALDIPAGNSLPMGDARIIGAIEQKIARGPEYAEGKFLLVFFDGAGVWYRKNVREAINGRHNFKAIYCIGLESPGPVGYAYTLTQFHPQTPDASISFKVRINGGFSDWSVFRLQDEEDKVIEIEI